MVAYVAGGTVLKSGAPGPLNVPLPAGHVAGHALFLFTLTDDNTGTTANPSGWTKLTELSPGETTGFIVRARLEIFYRRDTGSLGATVPVSFSSAAWPTGDSSVMAWTSAYSGVDSVDFLENWEFYSSTSNTATFAHPQVSTAVNGDWLMTVRSAYSNTPRTFTISGGTNAERVDDNWTNLHLAVYDSNSALSPGTQTQRSTVASGTCSGGGSAVTIVIKNAAAAGAANANAGTAQGVGAAYNPIVQMTEGSWDLCTPADRPDYSFAIDWTGDGSFSGPDDDVTGDITTDIGITYGRDQDRQLNPAAAGSTGISLINVDRDYSPEFTGSPLYGELEPARLARAQVTFAGGTYPLFYGRIDDYDITAEMADRSVSFTFLDGLADLQGIELSSGVYASKRTGELVNAVLDLAGWTGPRDIDLGATVVPFWWVERTNALQALTDLMRSEGPPAIAYQAPDGTFVFRDRHHRLLKQESVDVQATFSQPELMSCTAGPLPGYDFTPPFKYSHGWRDIVNEVVFEVSERVASASLEPVWSSEDVVAISAGQSYQVEVSTSDPFIDAVEPVAGVDFTTTGAGTINVTLSRTSGQSVTITLLAVGGAVNVASLQLRAKTITVRRTVKVSRQDSDSITLHGLKSYPEAAPWANANDADAIAGMILLHYARRRPTIELRITAQDPQHFMQVLSRTISDRIHLRYDELGLDADFFVERVAHSIRRFNQDGKPPVHAVVLGCEKDIVSVANPFTFDLRGAGFDDGVFDPIKMDQATTVFIFDHEVQGQFDVGLYGT